MVIYTSNPSIWEVGVGMSRVQGYPELRIELVVCLDYVRLCLKKKKSRQWCWTWRNMSVTLRSGGGGAETGGSGVLGQPGLHRETLSPKQTEKFTVR